MELMHLYTQHLDMQPDTDYKTLNLNSKFD